PSEQATSNNNPVERPKGNDPEIQFPADVTVKVRTQLVEGNAGFISSLSVVTNEKEEQVDGLLKGLKDFLVAKREKLTQKDNIKVQGDGKLKVREMMKVMDVCRQAGFTNVSMVPPEDFGR